MPQSRHGKLATQYRQFIPEPQHSSPRLHPAILRPHRLADGTCGRTRGSHNAKSAMPACTSGEQRRLTRARLPATGAAPRTGMPPGVPLCLWLLPMLGSSEWLRASSEPASSGRWCVGHRTPSTSFAGPRSFRFLALFEGSRRSDPIGVPFHYPLPTRAFPLERFWNEAET